MYRSIKRVWLPGLVHLTVSFGTKHSLLPRILLICLITLPGAIAAKDKSPLVVVTAVSARDVIEQVPLSGTLASHRVAELSPEISGQVEVVHVDVGDRVKAGDVLIELDPEIEQLHLEALQASVQQASVELVDSRRRLEDAQRLRKQRTLSENELRLVETEVEVKQAVLRQKQAESKRQQAVVARHSLRAPFAGVISARQAESGAWIEPGNPAMTLVAVDDLRIEFRVPQDYYHRIDADSTLTVSMDAFPEHEFKAAIQTVVPVSDPSSRTFLLHAAVSSDGVRLMPGMSVHAKLNLAGGRKALVVPRDALLRYPDGRVSVWVIEPGSEPPAVHEKQVRDGLGFNGMVVIDQGVQAGDLVVVQGNESLQDGQQVRIQSQE